MLTDEEKTAVNFCSQKVKAVAKRSAFHSAQKHTISNSFHHSVVPLPREGGYRGAILTAVQV